MPEYRRNLPHLQPEGATLFITWRLHGSLPVIAREKVLKSDLRPGHRFVAQDRQLDRTAFGPRWLADTRVALLVSDAIRYGEYGRLFYKLHAWVVMPNHVHILITPIVPPSLLMRWLKGSTARAANRLLGRTGQPFWQDESWDHWIRRTESLNRTRRYIEQNPVTAGLVASSEMWPWSSSDRQAKAPVPP